MLFNIFNGEQTEKTLDIKTIATKTCNINNYLGQLVIKFRGKNPFFKFLPFFFIFSLCPIVNYLQT
jgi:hypothetical protein